MSVRSHHPRAALALAVAAALCGAAALAGAADEPGFEPLFNGKDLSGWEGDKDIWSVQDGAITGVTTDEKRLPYNKFLIYRGGKPKNFHLKARLRLVGNSNSGIQYRSRQLEGAGEFVVAGYQMDVHPSPNYNAMLYDERGRGILAERGQKVVIDRNGGKHVVGKTDPPEPVKLDEWNDYDILARGNHLVHKLNGKTVVDVVDHQEKERELEGILAIQVHVGPAMRVQVKEITLKTLPEGGLIAPEDTPVPGGSEKSEKNAAARGKARGAGKARAAAKLGPAPPHTPAEKIKAPKGFKVELVHAVPRDSEGSWVSMTVDPKNRLIVSDQYGKLYRITPSPVGGTPDQTKVEPIAVPIGEAQGLCWAFDSLYVVVNRGTTYPSGLYRVRDTDGDDRLDKVDTLRLIDGGGEHGPHAVIPAPDGKSLYVVAGNATRVPALSGSLVPRDWGEDNPIPRMPDGAGFMRDEKAPGGFVCKIDPDGKTWTLVSSGFRNAYDIAFNRQGDLFTYDSDMEWDMNLPWYRPTRVCHVTSGSEFGYRNGSGKWPTYYLDSLPPVADIGPGSPTGIAFGYGAKFPAKYRDALFICDWSYGKMYALSLSPKGSTYGAEVEEFLQGTPLPLTDLVVNPADGALYFAVGGRKTTSALYRVVYTGEAQGDEPKRPDTEPHALRRRLEAFHGHADPNAVAAVWPYLDHPDRFVRFAARVALEFQDPGTWRDKALAEPEPAKRIPALLALTRVTAKHPAHRGPSDPAPDAGLHARIVAALDPRHLPNLSESQKLDLLRVHEVVLTRFGRPAGPERRAVIEAFDPWYPSGSRAMNAELARVLIALGADDAAEKTVALLEKAPTQEEQIDDASCLRVLRTGWTPGLRKRYFSWFVKAADYRGGNSLPGFMNAIKADAVAGLSPAEKEDLKPTLEAKPARRAPAAVAASRPFVKKWTLDELLPLVDSGLKSPRDFERGRTLYAAVSCAGCHRFNNDGGGVGPDLSGVAGRFSTRDLLESIVQPSKVISDQYQAVMISTTDGKVVTGRIVNLHGNTIQVCPNMLAPNDQVAIDSTTIDEMKPSPVSLMPEGLLDTLHRDEVLDLVAYLLSRGDRSNPMFK